MQPTSAHLTNTTTMNTIKDKHISLKKKKKLLTVVLYCNSLIVSTDVKIVICNLTPYRFYGLPSRI